MPKKGMKNSPLFDVIQSGLTLIGGLAGSIMAIYGLVKTFDENVEGFFWLIPIGIVFWLVILWRLSQAGKVYIYTLLVITFIGLPVVWVAWQSQNEIKEQKVIVLITKFDGPEDQYGIRDQILEQLRETTKGYQDTDIIASNELVTSALGSKYAHELGEKEQADLVIWAWYKPTENPNITIHIENLSPSEIETLHTSETYQPQATLAKLESFEIQRQLGSETSTLISFLTGLLRFKSGDYQTALGRFKQVLNESDISTYVNPQKLDVYIGYSYYKLGNYERAIQYYNEAIVLDPQDTIAYINRGIAYKNMGQYERAIQDYNKAIALDSQLSTAYNNRCLAYYSLKQYNRAIQDCDKAIALDPQNTIAYNNRGITYNKLNQYERAIQDFDKAIALDSEYAFSYNNRGNAYYKLQQYDHAIQDYNKAIVLDSEYASPYYNRGNLYYSTSIYEKAIQDYSKAIQIDPNFVDVYYNRGMAYQKLGKTIEAEADFAKSQELTGK